MKKSKVLQRLRSGGFALTATITRVPAPWLAEVVAQIGYDVIWYDLEHRSFPQETIESLALACRAGGIDLMVRIRKNGYQEIMQALECGADGILVPHCKSAAEARQWVEWTRFPPLGRRGFDGSGRDADHGVVSPLEHMAHANCETFLALQVEDVEALEQIEEIAAVPGFDILFVGPGDLSISLGVPMQFDHPRIQAAIDRVAAAAAQNGKWWAIPTGTPEAAQRALDRGARMVTGGGDHTLLVQGFRDLYRQFSQLAVR
jgi:4-hydroxy-2-oxoheptanedioate aldolase